MAERTSGRASEIRDRIIASDPGLSRLTSAVSVAVAMAGAMAIEYGYGRLTGAGAQGTLVAMLLGTVIAMMGSMALTGSGAWRKARTAVFFPVAIGTGLFAGVLVGGNTSLMLSVFVLVMFLAVFVRRFGLPFFFYGFMAWMGFFFAAFLHPVLSALPTLLIAVAISSGWVLLLSVTVLRTNSRRTLRRVQQAFGARARAVARACADLLTADDPQRGARLRRRLHARQQRLAEAALMIEAWSAEPGALPAGWSGAALRRRLLDAQLAIDALATAADSLATTGGPAAPAAARIADALARRDYAAAEREAAPLLREEPLREASLREAPLPEAALLAAAAVEYVGLARLADVPPETRPMEEEFEPAVSLAMGNLPGSAAVAGDVAARGRSWNPLTRLKLNTRQAVQVAVAGAVAIVVGREISEARYYWAVIAAFIAFSGTATRSETFIKATNRVVGTLVGLVAGIGLAHLTAGHTLTVLMVIVLSMSCGFYLVRISYALMIFFITIMVSQLYSVLNEFSAGLLVLRLEETAAGAAVGIVVALVVLPTSTRDTVHSARSGFFSAMSDLLRGVADHLDGTAPATDLDALARAVDHRLHGLALVSTPLTRRLLWGNDPRLVRHRLTLYAAVARRGRALAMAPRRIAEPISVTGLAQVSRSLASAADDLALRPERSATATAEVEHHLAAAEAALLRHRPESPAPLPPVTLPLIHLSQLLHELATVPRTAGPKHRKPPPTKLRLLAASAAAAEKPVRTALTDAARPLTH